MDIQPDLPQAIQTVGNISRVMVPSVMLGPSPNSPAFFVSAIPVGEVTVAEMTGFPVNQPSKVKTSFSVPLVAV